MSQRHHPAHPEPGDASVGGRRVGRRRLRFALARAFLVGLPLGLLAVVGAEVLVAARAEYLPDEPGFAVDATVAPAGGGRPPPLRLVMLGDSTVAGVGAPSAEQSLAVLVARRVADDLGRTVHVTGYGRSGARSDDVALQARALAGAGADVVVVVIGSNDVTHLTPPWVLAGRTARLVRTVGAETRAPVVLGGIPEFKTVPALGQPLRALAGAYAQVLRGRQRAGAASAGAAFVDIAAEASPRFLDRPESMSPDGFHPSPLGYGFWADALAPAVAAAARGR